MNATPGWLSLSRDDRSKFFDEIITPVFKRVSKTVKIQLYDSEYFHAKVSDFMIVTTHNFDDYKLFENDMKDFL